MSITFDELELEPGDEEPGRGGRRAIAVVGAVALVAAAVAVGYGVGRSADEGTDAGVADAAAPSVTEAEMTVETAPAPAPPTAPAPAPEVDSEDATPVSTVVLDQDMTASGLETMPPVASGDVGYSMFGSQPMDLLAERSTPSGFLVRAHLGETWEQGEMYSGVDGWQPPAWCYESGRMRIALSGNGVVDVGSVGWYSEPFHGRAISRVLLGALDGQPQWVIVVQAPADTTAVTATFADGTTDTATPQAGIALLTVPSPPVEVVTEGGYSYFAEPPVAFTVDFQGGATPAVVASDGTGNWNDPEFRASCQPPPPALPEPGVQPDDAESAEATIITVMTEMYDSSIEDRAARLDDETGVREAMDQVAEGAYADAAESAVVVIEELVFTSPTDAWFRYRIESSNGAFDARFGRAVLVDDSWKITRDTICQDLSLAGGDCGAGWQMVMPPTADTGADTPAISD